MSRASGAMATNTKKRARASKDYAAALATVMEGVTGSSIAPSYGIPNRTGLRRLPGELGCLDLTYTQVNVPLVADNALANVLNGCILGNTIYQRDGKQINLKSLQYRLCFSPADAATTNHFIRFVVVMDSGSNGLQPTWAQVFANQNAAGTVSSPFFAMPNTDFADRFKIMADHTLAFPAAATNEATSIADVSDNCVQPVTGYIKLRNALTSFNNGNTGTFSDISTGALWFFIVSNVIGGSGSQVTGSFRVRFTDPK